MTLKTNLSMRQGETFVRVLRWADTALSFKPITGITQAAPPVLTVTTHGLPAGWLVAVQSVQGMLSINAVNTPAYGTDFVSIAVVNSDAIALVGVDASGYKAYTSGGNIAYHAPKDLSGFTARMQIKDKYGGTVLASYTSGVEIVLDNSAKTITLTVPATATAAYTWKNGVYDFEVVSAGGVVTTLLAGSVNVVPEVTT